MSDPVKAFKDALDATEAARKCIAENRGYDKELARESYEQTVEALVPTIAGAIETVADNLEARDVERLAATIWKALARTGLVET